jgi:hypothetical protein
MYVGGGKKMIIPIIMTTLVANNCVHMPNNGPVQYHELVEEAVFNCKNRSSDKIDITIIETLIRVEKEYDVPDELRGMLLAAACAESGFNPHALGDKQFSKDGKTPKAVGLFQMWGWWANPRYGYGVDRTDPKDSATALMEHIVKQLENTKRSCKYRTDERKWIAAWVHAIRSPKEGGRCREKPNHLRLLRKWHRQIINKRQDEIVCDYEMVGC